MSGGVAIGRVMAATMAEEPVVETVGAVSPEQTVSAPVDAPKVETVAEATAAPTPSEGAAVAEATAPEAAEGAESAAPEAASLVEGAKAEAPAEAAKPSDEAPQADKSADKPVEAEAAAEPPPAPTYEAFKLPEGLSVPEERLTEFTTLLGKNGLSQEAGQELIDLHSSVIKATQEAMTQRQLDQFDETRAGWRREVDRRFGNRRDTVVNEAKWAIEQLFPVESERRNIWNVLGFTGAGDNPDMIDLLSRTAKRMRERTAPPQGLPARTQPTNPADRRYGPQRPTT